MSRPEEVSSLETMSSPRPPLGNNIRLKTRGCERMIVFDHTVDTQFHPYDKNKRCARSFLKDMLYVLQVKTKHALQIAVTQNMTLHCSLYAIIY